MLAYKPVFGSEDFRQYGYCPRKIYFRWVLHVTFPPTTKMKLGLTKHEEAVNAQKEQMKSLENGLVNQENNNSHELRYRELKLEDPELGIIAKIDLIELLPGENNTPQVIITELKTGKSMNRIDYSHLLQLGAQAMVAERQLSLEIAALRIFYVKDRKEITIEFTDEIRGKVLNALKKMRKIVNEEDVPDPTPNKAKCPPCECWKICLRV